MAEGGTSENPTTVSPYVTETSTNIDPRLIECPICLERLQHPKSLPCLHTFCEECLCAYITQEFDTPCDSFPCPICRSETVPIDCKEDRGNWAKQFPTNNLTAAMSKGCIRETQVHECDPCRQRDERNIAANVWWVESNRFLCDTCLSKLRDVMDDDHTGITLVEVRTGQNLSPNTAPSHTYCPKHKKEMDLYCEDHRSVCCSTCIAVAHRRCDVVTTLSEFGDKVRCGSEIQDMRTSLQEIASDMESVADDIKKQTKNLEDGRDLVLKKTADLRQNFETLLSKLQQNIIDELVTTYKKEKQHLDDMLHRCERMHNSVRTTQVLLESNNIEKNNIQMLSALQRGRMEIKACKDLTTQVAGTYATVELNLDNDDADVFDEILMLGRLNVTRTRREVPVNHLTSKPLSLADVKEVGKLCIKTASDTWRCKITGLLYLANGHILLADNGNEKVKMFKENGEFVDAVSLPGAW